MAGLAVANFFVLTGKDFLYIGTIFTFIYIMIAPGMLVLSFLADRKLPWALALGLSASLSSLILTLLGLACNTALPAFGISRPLDTLPLLAALDLFVILLLIFIAIYKKESALLKPQVGRIDHAIVLIASILPMLATAGAIILSNGGSDAGAMFTLGLIALLIFFVIVSKVRLKSSSYAILLYGMTVAILLMTSMRGYYLTGHDVQLEYQVFSMTNRLKFWDMANFQDAYNACLSITILPTFLESMLHVKDYYIYKFFFQFISGFLAVILFYLNRNFVSDKTAFLAGLVYITFPTFLVDMAMLNRQEMALLFFAGLIFILVTDGYFKGKKRSILLLLLGTGIILSHYSTSYITVAILIGAYIFNLLMRVLFSLRNPKPLGWLWKATGNAYRTKEPRLLQITVTLGLVVVLAIWTGPVTETSQNFMSTVGEIATTLQNPFKKDLMSGPKKYSLTNSDQMSKDELFQLYIEQEIESTRTGQPDENYYPRAITDKYKKVAIEEPSLPLSSVGIDIQGKLDSSLKGIYNETKQFYAKIMQIFILIGMIGLFFGYRFLGNLKKDVPMEYIALCGAGIFIMAMQIILPQSVIDYGLLRLFQQNLVLLSLPITLGFLAGFGQIFDSKKKQRTLFAGFLITFFLILSGFIPQLTGGGRPMLTLNNSGFYYDAYYIHSGEMDAYLWLKSQSIDKPVQSDRYFSNTKLLTYSDIGAHTKLLPEVTLKDAMVYLSYVNSNSESVMDFVDGDVLYYKLPIRFFDDNKNLVYSSTDAKIYD